MVEYNTVQLDAVFGSLADPTRRDILRRVSKKELSISTLAAPYRMSFAAIAKHVGVLEAAQLVAKRREGKQQIVSIVPKTVAEAARHLQEYEKMWNTRFDALDKLLREK